MVILSTWMLTAPVTRTLTVMQIRLHTIVKALSDDNGEDDRRLFSNFAGDDSFSDDEMLDELSSQKKLKLRLLLWTSPLSYS